jgi:flagellin
MDAIISPATRSALFALSSMQDRAGDLQTRLATGKRINGPIDGPISYFLAAGLSSRASAINGLMSGISNVQGAVQAANKGIAAIQALLTSARTIANQAVQLSEFSLVTVTGTNPIGLGTGSSIATTAGSASKFKAGDTVTVDDGTTTATYTAANGDTVQTFLNAINNTANFKITASLNPSGQVQLAATSGVNVTIGGTQAGSGSLASVLSLDAGTTSYTANQLRQDLATQFGSLCSQIDQIAADASFNGVNFLTGSSSTVAFNETGTSNIVISGSTATSGGLGVSANTNSFQLNTDVHTALTSITQALGSLQTISTTIGSMATIMQTRIEFNRSMMDTLNTGADALTADDPNADSAMLLALQTRQQIATTSLSLTRSGDNAILRLFG